MLARVPREGAPTLCAPSLGRFLKSFALVKQRAEVDTVPVDDAKIAAGSAQESEIFAGIKEMIAHTDDQKVRAAALSFGHSLGIEVMQ